MRSKVHWDDLLEMHSLVPKLIMPVSAYHAELTTQLPATLPDRISIGTLCTLPQCAYGRFEDPVDDTMALLTNWKG